MYVGMNDPAVYVLPEQRFEVLVPPIHNQLSVDLVWESQVAMPTSVRRQHMLWNPITIETIDCRNSTGEFPPHRP